LKEPGQSSKIQINDYHLNGHILFLFGRWSFLSHLARQRPKITSQVRQVATASNAFAEQNSPDS
jgi:hypothetical protein